MGGGAILSNGRPHALYYFTKDASSLFLVGGAIMMFFFLRFLLGESVCPMDGATIKEVSQDSYGQSTSLCMISLG